MRRIMKIKHLISTILMVFIVNILNAQTGPIKVQRTNEKINFDGKIEESVWELANPFYLIRQNPDYGSESSEKTDFRMLYDNDYIYIGVKNFSKDLNNIREFSKQRDGSGPMDWIGFAFDGYNDHANGLAFATSPAGNRWDASILVNSNGINLNASWNTYWEVKTSRDSNGWYAEFKIPISSLRFKSDDTDDVVMNFIAWRKIAYNNEFSVFPDFTPDWGIMSFANISMGSPILLKGIKSNNPVYLTPYVLGGISNEKTLNSEETRYQNNLNSNSNVGIDVKYALSPQLTLDATFNTDFAQTETDNFQVNLSRASLFYPEKREFFLERTGNFNFRFDRNNDAFYSRRIGLSETGDIESIYGGLKVVGRINKWDLGVLTMLLEDNESDKLKNVSLFRIKKQISESNGYFGGIITSDLGKEGRQLFTYGLDGQVQLSSSNFFKVALAKTESKEFNPSFFSLDNLRYNISLENINERGFHYSIGHSLVGKYYKPSLGFEERDNVIYSNGQLGYGLFPKGSKKIFRHLVRTSFYQYDGYESKEKESLNFDLLYSLDWKNGSFLIIKPYYREENLNNPLALSNEVVIPSGNYSFRGMNVTYSSASNKSLNGGISYEFGKFYDGNQNSFGLRGRWDGSKVAQLTFNYRYDHISFDNKTSFVNHMVSLASLFTFSTKYSLSSLIQYDDINKQIGSNIRFRYNSKEGNDLFLVITNINNTKKYREAISVPFVQSWQMALKYRHTFVF